MVRHWVPRENENNAYAKFWKENKEYYGIFESDTTIMAVSCTFKNTITLFVFPPQFCISIVFIFPWDHCKSQEKVETMFMQNFGGKTKSIMVFLKVAY